MIFSLFSEYMAERALLRIGRYIMDREGPGTLMIYAITDDDGKQYRLTVGLDNLPKEKLDPIDYTTGEE